MDSCCSAPSCTDLIFIHSRRRDVRRASSPVRPKSARPTGDRTGQAPEFFLLVDHPRGHNAIGPSCIIQQRLIKGAPRPAETNSNSRTITRLACSSVASPQRQGTLTKELHGRRGGLPIEDRGESLARLGSTPPTVTIGPELSEHLMPILFNDEVATYRSPECHPNSPARLLVHRPQAGGHRRRLAVERPNLELT